MNDTKRRQIRDYLDQSRQLSPALLDPEGHVSRGNAHYALGEYDAALEEFTSAVAQRPTYVNAQFNIGIVLAALGRFEEAELAFRTTIGLAAVQDVLLPEAYYYLAVALFEQKRYEEALEAVKSATERGGDASFSYLRAQLHALLGDAEASFTWLRKATAIKPIYRDTAREDPAFEALRFDPRFESSMNSPRSAS